MPLEFPEAVFLKGVAEIRVSEMTIEKMPLWISDLFDVGPKKSLVIVMHTTVCEPWIKFSQT